MVSFIHSGVLLLSVFVLSPLIGQVPLAALGGVLIVTAWRMNEWESIHFFSRARLKHALLGMLVTTIATAALDLTQAILIGIAISALIYLRQSASSMAVSSEPVRPERLKDSDDEIDIDHDKTHVYYLTGPIFFGSVHTLLESFHGASEHKTLIISMRGVPLIDAMGVQALQRIVEEHHERGGNVRFSGVQPTVRTMLTRTGLMDVIGASNVFWSAEDAIKAH
jgi:SulP family sulfate permease